MPEELQSLLDRIQKDGVDKADAEAARLVAAAKDKSAAIVKEAEEKARAILAKADQDSAQFAERGRKALEQAARDVVLSVGESVNAMMQGIVGRDIGQALDPETLKKLIAGVVQQYVAAGAGDARIEVIVAPAQQKAITDFFLSKFAAEMRKGLTVKADSSIVAGFRVSVTGREVQHDFTGEAIRDALCQLVRPQLAEIVKQAGAAGATR